MSQTVDFSLHCGTYKHASNSWCGIIWPYKHASKPIQVHTQTHIFTVDEDGLLRILGTYIYLIRHLFFHVLFVPHLPQSSLLTIKLLTLDKATLYIISHVQRAASMVIFVVSRFAFSRLELLSKLINYSCTIKNNHSCSALKRSAFLRLVASSRNIDGHLYVIFTTNVH